MSHREKLRVPRINKATQQRRIPMNFQRRRSKLIRERNKLPENGKRVNISTAMSLQRTKTKFTTSRVNVALAILR